MNERQTVLIDMDGPLADWDVAFFNMCQVEGIELDCAEEDQVHRYATEHVVDPKQKRYARAVIDKTRWYRDLPVVHGAIDGMNELAEIYDVWICTKPQQANKTVRDDKAEWVRDHMGRDWVQKLMIVPDKSLVRGAVLLDDAPKPEWLPRAEWEPVIFPVPFNRTMYSGLRRWTWGDDPRHLVTDRA